MTGNNVLVIWAETKVASGYASLVIAMIPIFVALIETALPGGERLNLRGWLGTLLGALGMLVLLWPTLLRTINGGNANQRSLFGFVLLLGAALSFAIGSVLSRRFRFRVDTFVATAWQIGAPVSSTSPSLPPVDAFALPTGRAADSSPSPSSLSSAP